MGLTKRADTWYFVKRINGQRFRVSTGFADKKSAERRAVEIEHDIRSGILGWKSTIPSFAEWWAVYRATYSPTKSSKNRDAQIVAHFLPLLGGKRLDTITKSDVVRYMNIRRTQLTASPRHKQRRRVSESTVRRERGLLQAIFERAIEEGHEIRNPFRGIKRGKDKARTRVLTLDEETKLMGALHPRFQRFVRFALGTGCRLEEIRGIDPKRNIDWIRGTVHVLGKFAKERDVPMQPDAKAALKEQLDAEGKLWTQNQQRLREVLAEGAVRARVTHLTPHTLRHVRNAVAAGRRRHLQAVQNPGPLKRCRHRKPLRPPAQGRPGCGEPASQDPGGATTRRECHPDAGATNGGSVIMGPSFGMLAAVYRWYDDSRQLKHRRSKSGISAMAIGNSGSKLLGWLGRWVGRSTEGLLVLKA